MREVPAHIFQTWETTDVPVRWREAQRTVLERNPTAQYTLITDAARYEVLHQYFPELIPTMQRFPYAVQRADLIRYVLMYVYGGIYLDLDYVCLQSLHTLAAELPPQCDVGLIWSNNRSQYVTNSFLMSRPGSTFWLDVITAACRPAPWWAVTQHAVVFATTGPQMLNNVWHRYALPQRIHVFEDVAVPCNVCQLEQCTPGTGSFYLLPIPGNSWHQWDSTALNWLYCHVYLLLFAVGLVGLVLIRRKRVP
jgi:mannosyltransferase OCH1-like enzyme